MKHFHSEYAFQKYKPHLSWRQRLARFFKKKQHTIQTLSNSFGYQTNPFRPQKKPGKKRVLVLIFLALSAFWIACLAYIPYFGVNKILYFGLNNTGRDEINSFIYDNFLNKKGWLPSRNYFFINTEKISRALNEKFAFESVSVIKKFPNELNVDVKEKISTIIYDNGKKYFLLDSGGTAIKFLQDVDPREYWQKLATSTADLLLASSSLAFSSTTIEHLPDYRKITRLFGKYPIVYDRRGLEVEIKQANILPPEHISAIIAWYKTLTEQGINTPKFFVLDNLNSGIAIEAEKAWGILFQPKNSDAQILILKEIFPTIKPREYIDLRLGEKVYWK